MEAYQTQASVLLFVNILADFPIHLEPHGRSEQLKKSGLGKVIMLLSKSEEEITLNKKLACFVEKWSQSSVT